MTLDRWLQSQAPHFNASGVRRGWGNPNHCFPHQPTFQRTFYRRTDAMGGRVTTSGYVMWQRETVRSGPGGRNQTRVRLQALRLFPESNHGLRQWGFHGSAGAMLVHLRHYQQYNLTVASLVSQGISLGAANGRAFRSMDAQARQLLVQQISLLAISALAGSAPVGPYAGALGVVPNTAQTANTILNP